MEGSALWIRGCVTLFIGGCGDVTWQLQGSDESGAICRIRTELLICLARN
jgi:hypothetical protein